MILLMKIKMRELGSIPYLQAWQQMRAFTAARNADTPDEIWLTSHPPVYTLGVSADRSHILRQTAIPIVESDRGGQITYHGPGQAIAYLLIDLRRAGYGIRSLVTKIETAVIELLASESIIGERIAGRPGVFVGGAKIAALGLRVSRGCTYHGVSLNVCCDLSAFAAINPCGWPGLPSTSMRAAGSAIGFEPAGRLLAERLARSVAR